MGSAVRSGRIESAIITDRVRNIAFCLARLPQFPAIRPASAVAILPRGTEFFDAETGGRNRLERPQVSAETERAARYRRKSPQKRLIRGRRRDLRFRRTGCGGPKVGIAGAVRSNFVLKAR